MNTDGPSALDIDEYSGPQQPDSPSSMTGGINLQHYATEAAVDAATANINIDPSPLIGDGDRDHSEQSAGEPAGESTREGFNENEDFSKQIGGEEGPHGPHPPTWRHPISSTRTYFEELSGFFGVEL